MSNIKNVEDKYGDDQMFESWFDINFFFPIATKLVDPLYKIGLTPNIVTALSTVFTFVSILFLHLDKKYLAFLCYLTGYILDCVDGRMARKYSMGSDFGMALDCVSDNVSNAVLFAYLLFNTQYTALNISIFIILVITSYTLSLSYGINEAISSYEATKSDNFYERRLKQLKDSGVGYEKYLYKLFIFINKIIYGTYRTFFPTYDKEKIYNWLNILKHFGPGNYCILVSIILLIIK